jgi:hypothetical protein
MSQSSHQSAARALQVPGSLGFVIYEKLTDSGSKGEVRAARLFDYYQLHDDLITTMEELGDGSKNTVCRLHIYVFHPFSRSEGL